jgi:hypothetical protein
MLMPMARPKGTGRPPEERLRGRTVRFSPGLWAELERRVPACERSRFIRRAVERELVRLREARRDEEAATGVADSILGIFAPGWSEVPPEEWERLPADLSENLDRYLYRSGPGEP